MKKTLANICFILVILLNSVAGFSQNKLLTIKAKSNKVSFNRFLIDAYTKRPKGKTVADLYPQIIKWFEENNK